MVRNAHPTFSFLLFPFSVYNSFMTENTTKKILIVGSSAKEYSLAQKLSTHEKVEKVFVAPGNNAMKGFCTVVDIREDNIQELLEFVLENDINLTIASSETAIKSDIATIFQTNNQMIFAPSSYSSNICTSKSAGKKFMYKNRIPCPKFAIFDKASLAVDYAKNSPMPIVVKTDEHVESKRTIVCQSFSIAKSCIEDYFECGEKKVIIEDFIPGHEFSFYVITDGYHALPLGSVANYKYSLEGNGGLLTAGMGAYTPDYKITSQMEKKILQQMIYPTLNTLARHQTPYVGIFGVDCILTSQEEIYAIEFNSFLQTPDCQVILALLNEDLYHLFEACVIGSFADDYRQIDISDNYAVSCVLSSGRKEGSIIYGIDDLDEETQVAHFNTKKNAYLEYETGLGKTLAITRCAKTLSRAVENLYEEISLIKFDGMKYRKDIAERIKD